jgi:hypothetical protein
MRDERERWEPKGKSWSTGGRKASCASATRARSAPLTQSMLPKERLILCEKYSAQPVETNQQTDRKHYRPSIISSASSSPATCREDRASDAVEDSDGRRQSRLFVAWPGKLVLESTKTKDKGERKLRLPSFSSRIEHPRAGRMGRRGVSSTYGTQESRHLLLRYLPHLPILTLPLQPCSHHFIIRPRRDLKHRFL